MNWKEKIKNIWEDIVYYTIDVPKKAYGDIRHWWRTCGKYKQHWKFVVTRDKYPDWQFNAIVCTYCKEEALLIIKKFFEDFGGIGFKYEEPSPKTEHKAPWVEISTKKIGTYRDFIIIKVPR